MNKLLLLLLLFLSVNSYSQDTTYIMTSAQCSMCKDRIENKINKLKDVKYSGLNLDTKVLTVVYDASKLTKKYLEIVVAKTGYDANKRPATKAAYKRLPMCCRKDFTGTCKD